MIVIPYRMRQQPQNNPVLDLGNPLLNKVSDVFLGGQMVSLVRTAALTVQGTVPTMRAGAQGMAFRFDSAATLNSFQTAPANVLVGGADCTIFIYRRAFDTTARASALFGNTNAATDRVSIHAPLNDGVFYFDYGNTSSGRLSVAFTKTTQPEALICVAGSGKGREIWRNGTRIASNGNTFAPSPGTYILGIGGSPLNTSGTDLQEIYLVGIVARAWSDAECREWSQNPWGIFKQQRRLWVPGPPSTVQARPQVFICT